MVAITDKVKVIDAACQRAHRLGPAKFPGRVGRVVARNPLARDDDKGGLWYVELEATKRALPRTETFWGSDLIVIRCTEGSAKVG